MTAFNRERFGKILALAESPSDGEALAAIRKAAALARAAGLSLGEAVEANNANSGPDAATRYRTLLTEVELASARRHIANLERQLASGVSEDRIDQEHIKGYTRGHKAGREEIELEVRMKANQRIREVEAELEAYKPSLDWSEIAEHFAFKNQRGAKSGYAKWVLLRARTNKLTPNDQAELRKFAAASKWGNKAGTAPPSAPSAAAPSNLDTPSPEPLRTAADRRRAVLDLFANPDTASLSDREIARRVGVSASTVGALRRQAA